MVIVTILIITLIIYFFISQNNATAKIDEFSNAIRNENEKVLSKILSTNKTNISEQDAKSFLNYLKDRDHYNQFIKELDNVRQHIKDDDFHSSDLGDFKDQNNQTYSKCPISKPLDGYTEGKINNKVFRTNKVYVKNGFSSDKKDIKLKFDLSDIEIELIKEDKMMLFVNILLDY